MSLTLTLLEVFLIPFEGYHFFSEHFKVLERSSLYLLFLRIKGFNFNQSIIFYIKALNPWLNNFILGFNFYNLINYQSILQFLSNKY